MKLDLRVGDAGENVDGTFRLNLWRGDLAGTLLADLVLCPRPAWCSGATAAQRSSLRMRVAPRVSPKRSRREPMPWARLTEASLAGSDRQDRPVPHCGAHRSSSQEAPCRPAPQARMAAQSQPFCPALQAHPLPASQLSIRPSLRICSISAVWRQPVTSPRSKTGIPAAN